MLLVCGVTKQAHECYYNIKTYYVLVKKLVKTDLPSLYEREVKSEGNSVNVDMRGSFRLTIACAMVRFCREQRRCHSPPLHDKGVG